MAEIRNVKLELLRPGPVEQPAAVAADAVPGAVRGRRPGDRADAVRAPPSAEPPGAAALRHRRRRRVSAAAGHRGPRDRRGARAGSRPDPRAALRDRDRRQQPERAGASAARHDRVRARADSLRAGHRSGRFPWLRRAAVPATHGPAVGHPGGPARASPAGLLEPGARASCSPSRLPTAWRRCRPRITSRPCGACGRALDQVEGRRGRPARGGQEAADGAPERLAAEDPAGLRRDRIHARAHPGPRRADQPGGGPPLRPRPVRGDATTWSRTSSPATCSPPR